ncbi:flagellar rod assembly protein/muramidase FlgJ [Gilliamella sp. wkB292]|uniref:flagellar assembly peptidoglycan hydrolase FlgJ n=1 Tax=Gilliamella sp. wkB292 TaxID=3120262 RepID=UPI00080DB0DD|nr:flagellar assembly peptidoglycan hydrolase FlgJ [Gilliamella apicola]OCG17185.1 flagellar rod assembly protein/muramidase FlgJ [Gilliamella apicola]
MNNKIGQSFNRFAYDLSSLHHLKRNVTTGANDSIKQVAEQFETLFINMMMQSMRKAVPEGGLFTSAATQLFTSMFDQQIAQQSAGKGLGLANMLTQQLAKSSSDSAKINMQSNSNNKQPNLKLAQSLFSENTSHLSPQALGQMLYHQHKTDNASQLKSNELAFNTSRQDLDADHVTTFVQQWLKPAKQASGVSGIPYEVIIAQAALETGWGQKEIKTEDNATSHNYFGIKATPAWKGSSTRLTTQEFVNNRMIKIQDEFKVYNSKQHALTDYLNLLTKSPRYRAVVNAPDARSAAKALQAANYATDPNYSDKLIQIIGRIEQIAATIPSISTSGFKQIAFN